MLVVVILLLIVVAMVFVVVMVVRVVVVICGCDGYSSGDGVSGCNGMVVMVVTVLVFG